MIILNYHSVDKIVDNPYTITPQEFERQMHYIRQRFSIEKLETALRNPAEHQQSVAITFDDGREDNYVIAFPILKKFNIPATIFVTTGFVGRANMLHWDQIRELVASGLISIQNHTHTHPVLMEKEREEIEREINVSQDIFEKELGYRPKFFAYPKNEGRHVRVRKIISNYFDMAFGGAGIISKLIQDRYVIPRVTISHGISSWRFAFMTTRLYWQLKLFRKFLHL